MWAEKRVIESKLIGTHYHCLAEVSYSGTRLPTGAIDDLEWRIDLRIRFSREKITSSLALYFAEKETTGYGIWNSLLPDRECNQISGGACP